MRASCYDLPKAVLHTGTGILLSGHPFRQSIIYRNDMQGPMNKTIYSKWRMSAIMLDFLGLVIFFLAIGISVVSTALFIATMVILWMAVVIAYIWKKQQDSKLEGQRLEALAKLTLWTAILLAIVISVMCVTSLMGGQ